MKTAQTSKTGSTGLGRPQTKTQQEHVEDLVLAARELVGRIDTLAGQTSGDIPPVKMSVTGDDSLQVEYAIVVRTPDQVLTRFEGVIPLPALLSDSNLPTAMSRLTEALNFYIVKPALAQLTSFLSKLALLRQSNPDNQDEHRKPFGGRHGAFPRITAPGDPGSLAARQ